MKNLFKKYYNSVLHPDEFPKVSDFIHDKKNEFMIFSLMKPFWNREINAEDVSPKTNPALYERIKEAISLENQKTMRRKIKIYAWGLRAAAVLVVALLVSTIFFFQKAGQSHLADQIQTIVTPPGAKTNITLPDGSLVWLNSETTLSYPLKFKHTRPVTLVGEAYFEVGKNSKPFVVTTNYGDVEVKGTSFNVKAYTDDNAFETTLEEGIVAFKATGETDEITLRPGEQVIKTDKGFAVTQVETKYFTSWKDGKLIFNREPFPLFIKKLERWYNVSIECPGHELNELWYTGTIEMESISEVMEMISKASPVTYSFNEKTRVFTINKKK
ncbi:FecR family protein [Maribellus sp. CM-23]|uniref:FecR family protein n=1 Tax=Maribellus sp. CM-23 TaxID=2781026 RepID=UPI001F3DC223|nr:FecR family protein [Maribellus sp. CM-23]MCE4564761.1 FecR family protein [Maribellus sp. CM-23]